MKTEAPIQLCRAHITHKRMRPFKHPFFYSLFCLRVRMDAASALKQYKSWLFGINQRRPVSLMNADHGHRDGSDLMAWLRQTLDASGVAWPGGAVWLQCFPRMFGYVFNPVSFWYLYDQSQNLRVLVAEVNNTFGQRHHYVLTQPDLGVIASGTTLNCQKVFHVSPFCPVKGHYRFEYTKSARTERVAIDYFDDPAEVEPLIHTAIAAEPVAFTTGRLLRAVLRMPLMTFRVMARIHWHAFKLWRQGATFHRLPKLPDQEVTTNQSKPL